MRQPLSQKLALTSPTNGVRSFGIVRLQTNTKEFVRYEVFTAVTMKEAVFWDMAPCKMVLTDVSEECIASIFRSAFNVSHGRIACGLSYIFPSTLKMEAIRSSETSGNTTSTRCHIPEDCFLHRSVCLFNNA
jgi:hypothetical protein